MRWLWVLMAVGAVSGAWAQTAPAALREFDGMYRFGWIADAAQTNLNMGSSDFLIEFKARPERITRANLPDTGIVAKKPFGHQPGYIVGISPNHDLVIYLNSRERLQAGKSEHRLVVARFFTPETWRHAAVLVQPAANRVTVFGDGKVAQTFSNVSLGDTDNWSDFTVGIANLMNHIRFHGELAYVGVWRFLQGAPTDMEQRVAALAASEDRAALAAIEGARYSFWKLTNAPHGVADLGGNGNFLRYMPESEAERLAAAQQVSTAAAPRTLYADAVRGTADGDGSAARPFASLRHAVLAARAGDTVVVRPGTYAEMVEASGGRRGAPLRIQAEPGAVVRGFETLTGWTPGAAEGVWSLRDWTGPFVGPVDANQIDGRRIPESIVFMDGAPLDWVDYGEDVIPGTYTIWPRVKHQPVTFHIGLLPDDHPTNHTLEVLVPERGVRVMDFVELRGLHLRGCILGLDGEGCVVEGNTVEWGSIGIYGANHRVLGNRILWAPNAGLAGGGHSGCLIASNYIAYANWRLIDPNHGGGGAKLIPCCIDNIVRGNTFVYNYGAGFWYDGYNNGNVVEYNLCHDNSGHGGVFDEIGFGNTIRYNVIFNNWCRRQNRSGGNGLVVGESPDDITYRNIVFNNERGNGIVIRGYANREGAGGEAAVREQSVKYPHHYVPAARQRAWLDTYVRYFQGAFIPQTGMQFWENISFDNHLSQFWTMRDYRVADDPKAAYYDFVSDSNLYYYADTNRIVMTGMNDALSLSAWQAISGQDRHSRLLNPYRETAALPKWATELFDFNAHRFRSAREIAELNPDMRDSIQIMILKARLARASVWRKLAVSEPGLRAWLMNPEGAWVLALWRKAGAGMVRVVTGERPVTLEDQWTRRRELSPVDGKVTVFVGPDPVYLLGVSESVAMDATYKGPRYGGAEERAVPRLEAPPTLDGELGDWGPARTEGPLAELNRARDVASESPRSWGGTNDAAARFWVGWCPTGLYFAVEITDDALAAGQDAVELFLDAREEWKHFFVEYQPGVLHLRLEPAPDGTVRISTPPYSKSNYYAARKPVAVGVQARCAVRAGGYTIEGFLPWGAPNTETAQIGPETIVRLGLLVEDGDPEKAGTVTLRWCARPASNYDTTGWCTVGMQARE